ncbi:hypothetical protein [Methanonatronarchaeum sp. AMET-Sl]|uniref:hypothetical protein n=1 Tax=Methanonatronarchaeum sp. AMET-Sl TaxID=3037654 RepID=UPI00244DBDB1|nr:hypothetical protein [Methanonatronarchaeum sp. AMET-Sl]WGI17124.1 hypothetical protein QEN48_06385 [Methanonatronarchaeum sp. AMET-Sl]WGI17975.1 hypothetical protein QEN48_02930 [Methanonatronarchaeum sp. AMET-Sl]
MKSMYCCRYCGRLQVVSVFRDEVRELKKSDSNFRVVYREDTCDLVFEGFEVEEYFWGLCCDLRARFGSEVEMEGLNMYFDSLECGEGVVLSFREWVFSNGGYEKDGVVYLPGEGEGGGED